MNRDKIFKVVSLVVALILVASLAVALGVFAHRVENYNLKINAELDSAFYQTLDYLGDSENKLKKVEISSYNKTKKDLLQEVYVNCELMGVSLGRLNGVDFDSTKLMKFVNQLGGFCSYLAKKLPDEDITQEEYEKLKTLTGIITTLEREFAKAGETVSLGGSLYDAIGKGNETLNGIYDAFDKTTVDYPEMIYDGPFSDGLLDREPKFLLDKEEISALEAKEIVEKYYTTVEFVEEVAGSIGSYLFSTSEGDVEISKRGGYLVSVLSESSDEQGGFTVEQALSASATFLKTIGYEDMKAVWVSENGNTVYINYAYVEEGVVFYPDLIKVKVSLANCKVTGLEAQNYVYNHVEREIPSLKENAPTPTIKEGFEKSVQRVVVIPTEWNTEVASYEIAGEYEGAFYYIYYDLNTLEEIKVMRVIEDEMQGQVIV